jgi:hypothetical protein
LLDQKGSIWLIVAVRRETNRDCTGGKPAGRADAGSSPAQTAGSAAMCFGYRLVLLPFTKGLT